MEYFKSSLKTVLGAPQGDSQQSGAETVEKLVERVKTSTLLDDRRDACRALKSLSKKFSLEVGAQAMDTLIHVLETDRTDAEIIGYALETLTNVITGPQDDDDLAQEPNPDGTGLGNEFTEIYLKKEDNVALLLDLLEETDFNIRRPAVKLLTALLVSQGRKLQESIVVIPMGISRLMDLLSDSREVIRNDALLLLGHLTRGHANIQKIVAFENAFDKLFYIIEDEDFSDGGLLVEDCLLVLMNLLKNNISNQNFFKEGSYIQKITPFFDLQSDLSVNLKGWSSQKVSNIHLMLQVIRTLVSPNNPYQAISSCQKVMNSCGLLQQLCSILMENGVPADILTEEINTVAEIIRGQHCNQEYFASVTAPSDPPSEAIVVLLMSMVNEKQPFALRCAVLYCFQCFLYRNELGQAQVIQTLLPTSNVTQISAGQLLCGGLLSQDSLSNWLAAVALSHALVDNPTQKEQLLRVQLATVVGNPPISLMKQCTTILQQGGKVQTRLGLLMLLCTWMSQCTLAVSHFLNIPTNVPYLTSQVGLSEGEEQEKLVQGICAFTLGLCIEYNDNSVPSFTKESLCQIISNRIGLETFLDKLVGVTKLEVYSQAAQKPHPKFKQPSDVMLDFEFCRLFKTYEGTIIKAVQPKPKGLLNGNESNMTTEQIAVITQYKEVIRKQDLELQSLKSKFEELKQDHDKTTSQMSETSSTIQQLKDQNSLLKAQRSNMTSAVQLDKPEVEELEQAKLELAKLQLENSQLKETKGSTIIENNSEEHLKQLELKNIEIERLNKHVNDLEVEKNQLKDALTKAESLEAEKLTWDVEKDKMNSQMEEMRKEQEDLLVFLTEQGGKIDRYKKQIIQLGGKLISDDELEDEELDSLASNDENED